MNTRKIMKEYIGKSTWEVNENSNQKYSLQGMNNHVVSKITKDYWLNEVYDYETVWAYNVGAIHIHDLGLLAPYCVGWDLQDLLLVGLKGVGGKVESSPAKHFRSALGQTSNYMLTLQSEAAGAQAFSSFDTLLAPFIRVDNLSVKEVEQAMQEFVFNMNLSTRIGDQPCFSNLTFDLIPPKALADKYVIVGGNPLTTKYVEYQKEMNMINKAFAKAMCKGDAVGRPFTFPIPTYNISKGTVDSGIIPDEVWEMAAKYGTPYFANFVNSDLNPDDAVSMCCRLRIDTTELKKRGGGLFGSNPLVGSIGVVTVNLPNLVYRTRDYNGDEKKESFFSELAYIMTIANKSLMDKRKEIEKLTENDFFPYSKFYLRSVKERFGKYWNNHFNTIGLIGMNEACLNLFGEDIASPQGAKFAKEVLNFMRGEIIFLQKESGQLINLEATPAEGTATRLAKKDKEAFSDIICANEDAVNRNGATPYYTNSTQLPVDYTSNLHDALKHQNELQPLYTGGTVFHLNLGQRVPSWVLTKGGGKKPNMNTAKSIIKTITENFELPYFSLNPTFSICPNCGYIVGEHWQCIKCGKDTEVFSKVVGYMRPVNQWNDGKRAEYKDRKVFKI